MSAPFGYNELRQFPQDVLILLLSYFNQTALVDEWAERIATWKASVPSGQLIIELQQYVPCEMYARRIDEERVDRHPVQVYAIWIATEAIPFSVYQRLARIRTYSHSGSYPSAGAVNEILFSDWMEVHTNHSLVQQSRARQRLLQAAEVQQENLPAQTNDEKGETVGLQ